MAADAAIACNQVFMIHLAADGTAGRCQLDRDSAVSIRPSAAVLNEHGCNASRSFASPPGLRVTTLYACAERFMQSDQKARFPGIFSPRRQQSTDHDGRVFFQSAFRG